MDPLALVAIIAALLVLTSVVAFLLGYDARGRDDNKQINDLVRGFEDLAAEIKRDPSYAGYKVGRETVLEELERFTARLRERTT